MSAYNYRCFIEGHWGAEKQIGAFLKAFDLDKHLTQKKFRNDLSIHLSFDENTLPYSTCAIWQIDIEKKEFIQVGELPLRPPINSAKRMGIEIVNYLTDRGFDKKVFIYGDATSQKNSTLGATFYAQIIESIDKLFYVETRILKRNENVAITGVFVNKLLEGDFGWKVLINENCETSLNDYMSCLENENGGMKKEKTKDGKTGLSYEKNGHFTDAFRYFFLAVLPDFYRKVKRKKI